MNRNPDNNPLHEDEQSDEIIGHAFRWSLIVVMIFLILAGVAWIGWKLWQQEPELAAESAVELPQMRDIDTVTIPRIPLEDITEAAGVNWQHVSGKEGEKLLPETMGGGVTIFDFDNDGDQDILLVGGCSWPWAEHKVEHPRSLCLYANNGHGQFTDVTDQANLPDNLYAMAAVAGDYDNDGWSDLFVTTVGKNRLFRNQKGKFVDVSQQAGVDRAEQWSTGATWLDYDRDGFLDLFVCNYVLWSRELDMSLGFQLTGVGRAYGQPTAFSGVHCQLLHNRQDGTFEDVTEQMGIEQFNPDSGVPMGKALAAAALDVNGDGWQDVLVANDTVQNFLFLNIQGKQFEESGIPMGVAFDRSGNATGAMGVDCGHFRNDESLGILIGNFANEPTSLYVAHDPLSHFNDEAIAAGIGPQSRLALTFGIFFADLDLDGRLDVVAANGHLEEEIAQVQPTQTYEQQPHFFWNAGLSGDSEFVQLDEHHVGTDALRPMVGRGAAGGDLDGDGDVDIVLVANSGRPRILQNNQSTGHHWLRIDLEGKPPSNRDALGAVVEVPMENGSVQRRIVMSARSYLSQCERVSTFGLGASEAPRVVKVHWPSGRTETFTCQVDRQHRLIEGTGTAID